jgi:hypothetical protein
MALKGYVAKKGSNVITDRVGWLPAKIGNIVPIPGKPEPRSKVLLTAAALLMAGSRCGAWRKPDSPSHRCVAALDREAERPPPEATVTAKRPIGGATPIVRFVKRGRRLLAGGGAHDRMDEWLGLVGQCARERQQSPNLGSGPEIRLSANIGQPMTSFVSPRSVCPR